MKGNFKPVERQDEEAFLQRIGEITRKKLEATKNSVNSLKNQLNELREVYVVEDKEGLSQWFNTDARFNEVRKELKRAERASKKPYFGRIDIEDADNDRRDTFYVGKAVIGTNPAEPEVIDWRAPIASVYYDHSLGKCRYKVPKEGIFEIDLKRKRTYEIEDNRLKDFYDSDVVANDDLLTKYLSISKRNVLSEIIATIQEEQNEVIRKNPHHNLLIQGSAGSGKTTVAMHRISYILYNYEDEFKPDGFYIVGSNKVLLNYITGVLPDLDVYGVRQMTMEELMTRLLYEDWDHRKMKIRSLDKKDETISIKGSDKWFDDLSLYLEKLEWDHIPREDIFVEKTKHVFFKKSEIEKVLKDFKNEPMLMKIEKLNDLLWSALENEIYGKYYSYNPEEQKALSRHFKNYFNKFFWKGSVFDIYKDFVEKETDKYPLIEYNDKNPDLYDLSSLAFIYKRIKETEVIQEAGHVVVDEAQDFGIGVYRALKYCMSKCTFTIMGDVSQNIYFNTGLGDWEELKKIMLPNKFDYFGLLRKSYRNTVEISEFATNILRHGSFPIYPVEPIIRHGEEVRLSKCGDSEEINRKVLETINSYREKNYETRAVICKDRKEAKRVYEELSSDTEVNLFSEENPEFTSGTVVLPIEYSKGLEFDAVIIYDASKKAYPKEDGYAKLLYVAATRALHELTVFYKGEVSGLLGDPVPENRREISFELDDFHEKPREFEEEFKTKEEIAKEESLHGDEELRLRDRFGPRRIVVSTGSNQEEKKEKLAQKKIVRDISKTTGYNVTEVNITKQEVIKPKLTVSLPKERKSDESEFWTVPTGISLTPQGHGKIDNRVCWVNITKQNIEITGAYGVLRITPVLPQTVRIQFYKNEPDKIPANPEEIGKAIPGKWRCVDGREEVSVEMEKLKLKIVKRTGEIHFLSGKGQELLTEHSNVSRQVSTDAELWWNFFDFGKKEALTVRGIEGSRWEHLESSAKYISHGKDNIPAVIMSSKGYQIMIPEGIKVLACTIPTYGQYLRYEGNGCIDYIFRSCM